MEEEKVFVQDDNILGKETRSIPKPQPQIGLDETDSVIQGFADSYVDGVASTVDISLLNSMTSIAQTRDTMYTLLDTMADDSSVSAILDAYAAYATEYNDEGRIVWVESSNSDVAQYVDYLLKTLQVDKHIYSWVYSLIKYGDVYLRLYKNSEYANELFPEDVKEANSNKKLNEDIYVHAYKNNDKFIQYVDQVKNPAEMFELSRFGKTQAYIQANLDVKVNSQNNPAGYSGIYRYAFKKGDIDVYQPNIFVHGCLEEASNRYIETVQLFLDDNDLNSKNSKPLEYSVRRGKSILYDNFKVWRERALVENSLLLNRVTKSSIVRVIGVEVGDMDKNQARSTVQRVKSLVEQKSAYDTGKSMSEYTNPGPIENNVYMQTRNGKGAITTTTIGGDDVNVRDIADLDYLNSKFYGSFNIPKEYFGFTDDNAGFNGGSSLSIISSGFAKEVKRIQNATVQMLTTLVNIFLLDRGMNSYVNHFRLRMLPPTTQEELDRRDNTSNKLQIVNDTLTILSDIEDPVIKLKITKSLLSNVVLNNEVVSLIDDQIQKLKSEETPEKTTGDEVIGGSLRPSIDRGAEESDMEEEPLSMNDSALRDIEVAPEEEETTELPSPEALGIDMTQNTGEEE